jgi:hypothetical protein
MKRINKSRMTFKGYGNTQSLKKGSALDRRVELLITKNDMVAVEAKK